MNQADLLNAGISFVLALFAVLVATGVIRRPEPLKNFGWMFWAVAIVTAAMGCFKLFGVMR